MNAEIDKQLMLKFLEKNYPISRVKHNNKFRRAIILDNGGTFVLGEESHHIQLRFQLIEVLKKVFSCDESITRAVLNNFLNTK
jgi:hypothetical protein